MTSDKPLNVYQRRAKALGILAKSQFDLDNANSQFKSVSIDQMRNMVGKVEAEVGIACTYEETAFDILGFNGKVYSKVSAIIRTYNVDNPEDYIEEVRTAIAYDTLDKGFNKAESFLWKNHYKAVYQIAARDGEDPDFYSTEEAELLDRFRKSKEEKTGGQEASNRATKAKAAKADSFFGFTTGSDFVGGGQ